MESETAAPQADAPLSVREAALAISAPPEEPTESEAAPDTDAAPEQVSSPEDDAGPVEKPVPGETEEADPADEPSIDPPRSWSKEHKDAFKALPRHLQEAVSESERAREADFLRRQNEVAEQRKATEAEKQAAEQARQRYESQLPVKAEMAAAAYYQQFGRQDQQGNWHPPSTAQLQDWAVNDPEKYNLHDLALKNYNALKHQADEASARQAAEEQRQEEEFQANYQEWAREQAALFEKEAPEFVGEAGAKKRDEAVKFVLGRGISKEALAHPIFQLSGMQLIIRDAMLYREAQKAAAKPSPKPVPPVPLKPGPSSQKGEAKAAQLQEMDKQLSRTGNARDAARLIAALR